MNTLVFFFPFKEKRKLIFKKTIISFNNPSSPWKVSYLPPVSGFFPKKKEITLDKLSYE